MARTPFKMRSGNSTPFKKMGSSPLKQDEKKKVAPVTPSDTSKTPPITPPDTSKTVLGEYRKIASKFKNMDRSKMSEKDRKFFDKMLKDPRYTINVK